MDDYTPLSYNHAMDVEYFEMCIYMLAKERMKITRRGRLSEFEDRRLDEIDAELQYWDERIATIYNWYDYEDDCGDEIMY